MLQQRPGSASVSLSINFDYLFLYWVAVQRSGSVSVSVSVILSSRLVFLSLSLRDHLVFLLLGWAGVLFTVVSFLAGIHDPRIVHRVYNFVGMFIVASVLCGEQCPPRGSMFVCSTAP